MIEHLKNGDPGFYRLYAATVMPDHVHIIIKPNEGMELPRLLKGIKGVSARKINKIRGSKGRIWQEEYWDRIIRDENEFQEKLDYIYFNPVKNELVKNPEEWNGSFFKFDN